MQVLGVAGPAQGQEAAAPGGGAAAAGPNTQPLDMFNPQVAELPMIAYAESCLPLGHLCHMLAVQCLHGLQHSMATCPQHQSLSIKSVDLGSRSFRTCCKLHCSVRSVVAGTGSRWWCSRSRWCRGCCRRRWGWQSRLLAQQQSVPSSEADCAGQPTDFAAHAAGTY